MKPDLYNVISYPKEGFATDPVLQEWLTLRSKRVDRHMKVIILGFAIALLVAIVLLLKGIPWGVLGFIPLSAIPPLAALFYLPPPRLCCSSCGKRMKRDFALIDEESARYGEFLVCNNCHQVAFTHRASRP